MKGPKSPGFDTLSLHAGTSPDPATGARAVPIVQSAGYVFKDADTAAALFNLEQPGHVYSRISNPTVAALEEKVCALEGGTAAVASASGQAAVWLAISALCSAGDHIVASASLYGGTHNLLCYTLPRFGIRTTFVNPRDPNAWSEAIQENTRLLLGETLGNPGLEVLDLPALCQVSQHHRRPLMVDNTLATPYLLKPAQWGAAAVVHSATKFLGGHGNAIGGVMVDTGAFDWANCTHVPTLNAPYPGFHGMVFSDEAPTTALALRARREGLRDFGGCLSAHSAFLLLQGIETLGLRMQKHCDNALALARFLEQHSAVQQVSYPGLPSHRDHALAQTLMPRGAGGVLTFEVKGGRAAGATVIEKLSLFSHMANIGDAKSLVIHPASTTHFRMSDEDLKNAGVTEGMVRLSVGLEDPEDLMDDLDRALKASQPKPVTGA